MPEYTKIVRAPAPSTINTGLSACKASTLRDVFGEPREAGDYSQKCQGVTGPFKGRIVTEDVGPFKVTGMDVAVASLKAVFAEVKAKEPELYALLGTAGMLCVRFVRGSTHTVSNHSWGTAVDLTIGGDLPAYGAKRCPQGFVNLYSYFHRHGWYWGAEFPTTDCMHFELADETVRALGAKPKAAPKPPAPAPKSPPKAPKKPK